MFSLENGQQYALSSNQATADLLQVETKTYVFLKLTDSAYRAIEDYQKNNGKSQKCVNRPKVQFTGDTGVIKIPGVENDSRAYKFTLAQIESNNSSSCIKHDGIRSGCREIEALGTMGHKITICADDDVYQQTRVKMTQAEEENKKICTKEIKPAGSKYRAKLNKKVMVSSRPQAKKEIKSSTLDRILAQAQGNLKPADAKPARVAHRPRPADAATTTPATVIPAKIEPKPTVIPAKSEPKPNPVIPAKTEPKATVTPAKSEPKPTVIPAKSEPKAKVEERPSFAAKTSSQSPLKKVPGLVSRHSPNIREESLKRPGPPVQSNPAKKPRCSDPEPTIDTKTNMVDNAASHWKKQPLNQNQNSRNFFSDRLSPDCRPKLAVPPMPAPKHSDSPRDQGKEEKREEREESMKENHDIGAEDQYVREYTEICSVVQRVRYKQDFNSEYEEYQKLHANISAVSRKFQRMENDLKSAEEGTKMHEKIKKAIVLEYVNCKKDPRYVKDKSRFDHLHKKLSHIKKLIVDYDQRQITTQ